jgi:predicted small secreted protein
MKKAVTLILCLILLVLAGCRNTLQGGGDDYIIKPSEAPNKIENKIVKFTPNYYDLNYWDSRHNNQKLEYTGEEIWDFYNKSYLDEHCFLEHLTQKLTFKKNSYLYESDLSEEVFKSLIDLLSSLYCTEQYENEEMFRLNIDHRKQYLDENTDFSNIINNQIAEHKNYKAKQNGRIQLKETYKIYTDENNNEIRAFNIYFPLIYTSNDFYNVIPQYLMNNKASFGEIKSDENGLFSCKVLLTIIVYINQNDKVIGFTEVFNKADETPKRLFSASSKGIALQEKFEYYPGLIDDSFNKSVTFYQNEKTNNAQKTAVEALKYFIHLNKDVQNNYFDGFYDLLSDDLKQKLKKDGTLERMLYDAKKHNIKIILDPKSEASVGQMQTNSLGVGIEGYKDTSFGNVYKIERICYIKTGSEEFNKKYGFPCEKGILNLDFYVAQINDQYKVVAFSLSGNSKLFEGENYDQIWQGNWDNG